MQLTEHTTLITGAGSGLGAALTRRFVEEGSQVGIVDIDADRARAVADKFNSDMVLPVAADVTDPESINSAVGEIVEKFGKLDTVIPNAGIWDWNRSVTRSSAEELSEIFDKVMAVNVKGYLLTVEATWRHLLETRGSYVMTLSNAAYYSAGGGPSYTASKFAIRGLITQFAYELAPKIRVNGVAVGGMRTNLSGPAVEGLDKRKFSDVIDKRPDGGNPYLPLHDISTDPESFVGPYVMLASSRDGANMTGTIINIDGGISARGFAQSAGGDNL